MNLIHKFKSARRRLDGAIRRHGLVHVVAVVGMVVLRNGLSNTLLRAGSGLPVPQLPRGHVGRGRAGTAHPPAADLDEAYTLSEADWVSWAAVLGAVPASADPRDDRLLPLPLTVVIQGHGVDADADARTQACVAAMDGTARVWSGEPVDPTQFVVFLKAGDAPCADLPNALARAARGGVVEVVSFNLARRTGGRVQPILLPGANPTLLDGLDYVFSRIAVRGDVLADAQNLAVSDPRTLVLEWLKRLPPLQARGRWRHIGQPMAMAEISDQDIEDRRQTGLAKGRLPVRRIAAEGATVVICTKDRGHLARQLVHQLLAKDRAVVEEVVIVSNGTTNPYALQTLADLGREPRVRVIRHDTQFNFSRQCNCGVRAGQGRGPILLLNDDIAPVSEDWLERLMARLDDPAVGAVGPLLLYPDERVQHAGMYIGYTGIAGHILRGARLPQDDYLFTAAAAREVGAVTGAVLLTPRATYEALNGLDEQLATYLQDVDYCLRVRGAGQINVFEPASVLIHMESASIRSIAHAALHQQRHAEWLRFTQRWGEALRGDSLHPQGFDLDDETQRRLAGPAGKRPG